MQWGLNGQYDNKGNLLVVGITLGTKVSWATAEKFFEKQIHRLTEWPESSPGLPNVPTKVAYKDGQPFWGWRIPYDARPTSWLGILFAQGEDSTNNPHALGHVHNAMTDYFSYKTTCPY
ncbi:hypothetical protein BJX64DRAFT_288289 [Aspergillus heterothallicus]